MGISMSSDILNVITLNQGIAPFYKSNPYTIDNIQIYLNKFELSSMILSKEFGK